MSRLLLVAKTALLLAAAALFASLAVFVWTLRSAVNAVRADVHTLTVTTGQQEAGLIGEVHGVALDVHSVGADLRKVAGDAHALLRSANGAVGRVNVTLDTINRPCGGGQACGTLADVARLLNTYRGTAGQIETALNHENKLLDGRDAQENDLYNKASAALAGWPALEQNASASFTDLDVILKNGGALSGDLYARLHPILVPPPCTGSWCWMKRTWPVIRGGSELAEPGYFFVELLKAVDVVR
jgi:hypothetical protein